MINYQLDSKRQRFGLRWETENPPKPDYWRMIVDGGILIAGLFAILAAWTWAQNRDLEDRLDSQKAATHRYSGMLADCMNGKALYDKNSGNAYFCDRVIEIHVGKSKK